MRLSRMYYEGDLHKNATITLPRETSHYILNVLRLKVGASLVVFNGLGGEWLATLTEVQKKLVHLTLQEQMTHNPESALTIHLGQSLSKGEKMDWIIQKAVELGVTEITPLITKYGNVRLDEERSSKRLVHWQRIMISACEQSGRTILPTLHPITDFSSWIAVKRSGLKLLFHPQEHLTLSQFQSESCVTLVIGPEGGLSEDEVLFANRHDFVGVSLGPRILRTETAAIAALALIQNHWGDLN